MIKETPIVNLITLRMRHHARSSGYDRLCDYVGANVISTVNDWSLDKRILMRLLRFATERSGQKWYHRESLYSEVRAARQWLRGREQIFHFLYGENSYRYLGNLKALGRQNAIICSYHTPPEKFDVVVNSGHHLKKIDAVVVVSTMQLEHFSSVFGEERVNYIPHGIDVEYYSPGEVRVDSDDKVRCLFVGSHLRDLETLAAAAKILKKVAGNIIFKVVTKKENMHYFSGCHNVEFLCGIESEDLLGLYRRSDMFVMPLLECTANNGLLEAMACGLPIVSTNLQGVRDYVNEDCALLAPKADVNTLVDIIEGLAGNPVKRKVMSDASRKKSLDFRWELVAKEMNRLYRSVG